MSNSSNVTGGIILIVGAAALISFGVSSKGQQILDILTGKTNANTQSIDPTRGKSNIDSSKKISGSPSDPDTKSTKSPFTNSNVAYAYPGTFAGEKGASIVA